MKSPKESSLAERNRGTNMRAGFTLLELILVIAVSSTLFGLSVPAAIRFYQSQLVDDTARTLLDTLKRARTNALFQRNDASFGVKLSTSTHEIILFQGLSYASRVPAEDEIIDYASTLDILASASEVTFSRLYGTSTYAGTWMVADGSLNKVIQIDANGLMRLP